MSLLRRLLHGLGVCWPEPGVDPEWSIRWSCYLCGDVKPGGLAGRRK